MAQQASLPALRTARLAIRLPGLCESAELARYHLENRHRLDASVVDRPAVYFTADVWEARIRAFHTEWEARKGARFVLTTHEAPGVIMGTIGLLGVVGCPFYHCYLGYGLAGPAEGRGYMQEGLAAVTRFAFEELRLHRVMANYNVTNVRSGRLLERLGFQVEGLARAYVFEDGIWRDSILTSLHNPAWVPPDADPIEKPQILGIADQWKGREAALQCRTKRPKRRGSENA